ncbi:MAG TPA: nicotinate phosphoribosyltransferase [Phycisphaerae bacterium]|nr:nicotinate phosphoribosyltransferase [Phycisphaerae bacterium]
MNRMKQTYRSSLMLLTDLYQLTMAYGYWKHGCHKDRAAFHAYFRKNPFGGGFTLSCGLAEVLEVLSDFRFDQSDLAYLATLTGNDGQPLFDQEFLAFLKTLRISLDLEAIPEGTVIFPNEPLIRVTGPILQCQLVETILLNIVNFQTLIATKAARICLAAKGDAVFEFGLRRAQGIDGALAASRAAYIGGCVATSNVLAGKLFGIPVRGTHAHSWVMSFDDELQAFEAYAAAMPNNCVFLVDTYDTLEGVRRAAAVGIRLRESGHKMVGIRLDSGDLAYLSIEARKILDTAGLNDAIIIASNDLDETIIESLKLQGATIALWGVGTNLVTGAGQSALGGVYKLTAEQGKDSTWIRKVKASDVTSKSSIPGLLQVRRFTQAGNIVADAIFDEILGIGPVPTIVDPADPLRRKTIPVGVDAEDLLVPVMRDGKLLDETSSLQTIQARAKTQINALYPGITRFTNPHNYPVGLEEGLAAVRTEMLLKAKEHRS